MIRGISFVVTYRMPLEDVPMGPEPSAGVAEFGDGE